MRTISDAALRWLDGYIAELKRTPNRFADDIWELEQVREALALRNPPSGEAGEVTYQCREIGEGGWRDCSKAEHDRLQRDPHHDTRALPTIKEPTDGK